MANTHLPDGYVESLRAGYSKRQWEQEVEAKLLKPETGVYPEFSRERHVRAWVYDPALPYDIAIDWGRLPHVLFLQSVGGETIIFDEFCDDGIPRDHLREFIRRAISILGKPPAHCTADRANKSENSWFMGEHPATWTHWMKTRTEQDVRTGIEVVRTMLDPVDGSPKLHVAERLARNPPARGIVKCLEGYRYKQRATGELSDEPYKDNKYDHGCDALRYHCVARGEAARISAVVGRTHASSAADAWGRRKRRA
jgi:hypothetical protein